MSPDVLKDNGEVYKSPPLSPRQKELEFRIRSTNGSMIVGGYVDGAEQASYAMTGRTPDALVPELRVLVRYGAEAKVAARMLRRMADELEGLSL